MSARDDILSRLRHHRDAPAPPRYVAPSMEDCVAQFVAMAGAAAAEVHTLASAAGIPTAVADALRARNLPAHIHIPAAQRLRHGEWTLAVDTAPPGPDDAALALAPLAIAETGTLVYPATAEAPSSWHFRAGMEIAVIYAGDILPTMEDVIARLGARLPPTLNFVTGPSRTGDIEQTLELGAHGPKELVVLVIRDFPPDAST